MPHWLTQVYVGNRLLDYLLVAAGLLLSWLVLTLVKRYVLRLLRTAAARTATEADNVAVSAVDRFLVPLGFLLINYYLINRLALPGVLEKALHFVVMAGSIYLAVRMANHALHAGVVHYMRGRGESESRITQLASMLLLVKALVWILGLLLLVSNMGVNVAAALTGLGIGGIAIALATQNIFADLFSYFVIFFDKPFEVGDAIMANNQSGVVERIGIKTTQVRSHDGQLLVVPNAELVKTTIHNFRQLERRRVVITLWVDYRSHAQAASQLEALVRAEVEALGHTNFGHCVLRQLGERGLQYELEFQVNSANYGLLLRHQDQLLTRLVNKCPEQGIELVMPAAVQPVTLVKGEQGAKK